MSTGLRPPKGLLFDLGGTLLTEIEFNRIAGRSRVLDIAHNPQGATLDDYAAVASGFASTVWADRTSEVKEFSVRDFGIAAYPKMGLTFDVPPEEIELEFWRAACTMQPEPGVAEMLAGLHAKGLPLGVVSNSVFSARTLSWELDRHGLLAHFAFVLSSADHGLRKPHSSIFHAAADKLGVPSHETWFLGDSPRHDIAGARNAGMTALWYNPRGATASEFPSDGEVRHWDQLGALLR